MNTRPSLARRTESRRMQRCGGRRLLLSLSISLAIHGALAGLFVLLVQDVWVPKLEVTWLDLDNVLGVEPAGSAAARPKPRQQMTARSAGPKRPGTKRGEQSSGKQQRPGKRRSPRKAREPAKQPVPGPPKLDQLAPKQAALILLLDLEQARRSPYARSARQLLEVFYDYNMLLSSEDIDPMRDLDALLIATPNPYRVTQTFLAARHHLRRAQLRAELDKSVAVGGGEIRWKQDDLGWVGVIPSPPRLAHDPRVVVLREGLVMLVDPALRGELVAPGHSRGFANDHSPSLINLLGQLGAGGGSDERKRGPALLLRAVNLNRLLRLPTDLPPPSEVRISVPATAPALARGRASFASPADAAQFLTGVRTRLQRAQRSLLLTLLGLSSVLRRVKLHQQGPLIEARLRLSRTEVIELLAAFRGAIPQVVVPGMPPRRRTHTGDSLRPTSLPADFLERFKGKHPAP